MMAERLVNRTIEWFRVIGETAGKSQIVCDECLYAGKGTYALLNRVFGASQTCSNCGVTDRLPIRYPDFGGKVTK